MRHYIVFFLFIFCHSVIFGQADIDQVRQQYEMARQWNELKDFEQAADAAQSALQSLRTLPGGSAELEIGLIHILGDCSLEKGDHSQALSFYQSATTLIEKAFPEDDSLNVVHLNKVGNYYREIKDFEKALEYLNKGLEFGRRVFDSDNLDMANLYNNIGICHNKMGDYDKALEYYLQALSIRSRTLPEGHPQIAQSHNNLGLCQLDKGQHQQALQSFEQAISTYYLTYGRVHQDIADVHLNRGNVFFELQEDRLFSEYQTALEIYTQTLGERHPSVALCYNNLANAYARQNNFAAATELYQQSLDIMVYNYGTVHPDVAMSIYNTGLSYYFAGKDEQARQLFVRCLTALNYHPETESPFDPVNNQQLLLKLFKSMAELEIEAYYNTQGAESLKNAFEYYRLIDRLLDKIRAGHEAKGSKLYLMTTAHDLYDSGIELAIVLFQLTGEDTYLHEAFQFSEKSKGILLLEALQKTEAEAFLGIPPERIKEIGALESSIGELEKKRFLEWEKTSTADQSLIDSLSSLIFDKKQTLTRLIGNLERKYPQYYNLRYETGTLAVEKVQNELLSEGQTILEYFLGANSLQIFVINKNDFRVISVNLDDLFFKYLDSFNQAIMHYSTVSSQEISENLNKYIHSAHKLYQYLIEPVEELLGADLVIIPDGELGYLSFGALLSELPEDALSLPTHPYLIREYAISYNYSVRLLKEMNEKGAKKRLQPYLGLAPQFLKSNEKGLNQLKYNRQEIQGVRDRVGGKVLVNEEATKVNFVKEQSDFRVLHLATHGKANSAAGDYSFLAFSETPEVRGDEALLFVKEVYNMSTHAEMIVLSACETGAGELQKGEGIASIARSFSYAGAKSLLATQWSVDDKATHDLVQLYFEQLENGLPKDRAMQKAMLNYFDSHGKAKAHPYYWASFVLIGNTEPLSFQSSSLLMFWGLPVLLVGLLVFFKVRK